MGNSSIFHRRYFILENLIVKNVDVLGDSIMAAKGVDGYVYAGVSYFCNALGMTKGQKDRQVTNVRTDEVLKRGCLKLEAGVLDPNNETIALRIDFIPLWLAKITITEKTRQERPEFAEKLLNYQLKAKDILANAFIDNKHPENSGTLQQQIQLIAQGTTELYQKVDTLTERIDKIELDLPILPIEADRITEAVRRKGVSSMGGKQSSAYQNRGLRQKVYNNIYANLKYNFAVRSYKAIKRSQCDRALEIVNEWKPPVFLMDEITACNCQMSLDV